MTDPFLSRVAEHVLKYGNDAPEKLAVVLPSQRAAVYFRQHFSRMVPRIQFAPQLLTLDQLVSDCTSLQSADSIELLFQLYQSYTEVWQADAEPFDRFLKWASLALADFSEVDAYLIDPKAFFRDLTNLKELDAWSLNEPDLTSTQQQYAWFWKKLGALYFHFTESLKKQNIAHAGLLFRDAAENIESKSKAIEFEHIFFCGFNALSASEEKIMQHFVHSGRAEMLWDADRFYLDYPQHEAGQFLRRNFKHFAQSENWISDELRNGKKSITIAAAPNEVAQCDLMAKLLSGNNGHTDTAVILANENLLTPVLNTLPDGVDRVNVTMGLKTLHSPLHSLFELLFEWLRARTDSGAYHYRYVVRILGHPYLRFSDEVTRSARDLVTRIKKENKVFIRPDEIESLGGNKIIAALFRSLAVDNLTAENQLAAQFHLVRFVLSTLENKEGFPIEKEYLFHYLKALRRIELLVQRFPNEMGGDAYQRIFGTLTASEKLNFVGEPLEGLQVMGMLETRALDFRNLIILSCNEHVMPGNNTQQSLIPFELKKFYQLPTRNEKEAIYAYYFYRLLQRAENVHLVYSTDSNSWQGAEPSRYLAQLQYDFKDIDTVNVQQAIAKTENPLSPHDALSVDRTETVLNELKERLEKGLSPSALNKYQQCPLDFYYTYLLGYKEAEEVEETIEHSTLGTAVHDVLEDFYKPLINGKPLNEQMLKNMIPQVRDRIREKFAEIYSREGTEFGINKLIFEVAVQFTTRFLQREISELKAQEEQNQLVNVLMIEEQLSYLMPVETPIGTIQVRLHGKADRIDQIGNVVRVIDYKTGKVNARDVKLTNPEEDLYNPDKGKALQLMIYALMVFRQKENITQITAANVSMRNLSELLIPVHWGKEDVLDSEIIDAFEEELKKMIAAMFLNGVPFEHRSEAQYCNFCDMESAE